MELKPRYGHGKPAHPEINEIINKNRDLYKTFLLQTLDFKGYIHNINKPSTNNNDRPVWNNGFLPGLDIITLYTMLSITNPKKYIEIGSGTSTKVVYKAKQDNDLKTQIVSIDPYPRSEIDHLADKIIRQPFENINYDEILSLEENDILFIDNSHRILPNSDSMVFYLEILPKLKKGVIVHIHDIYLPFDYPEFMCERAYSEQYGLAIYLLANSAKFNTILPNYYISQDKELSSIVEPIWNHEELNGVEKHGGSFWIKIME